MPNDLERRIERLEIRVRELLRLVEKVEEKIGRAAQQLGETRNAGGQ